MASTIPHVLRWRVALRDSELGSTPKLVGFVLSTYYNPKDDAAWPSRSTIAAGASITVRAVDKALPALEDAGFVAADQQREPIAQKNGTVVNRRRGGNKQPNRYRLIIPTNSEPRSLFVAGEQRTSFHERANVVPRKSEPRSHEGVTEDVSEGALEHDEEIEEEEDPTALARRRLDDPAFATVARRLWQDYAPNHFVQALTERGTRLETAQAIRGLLEEEEELAA